MKKLITILAALAVSVSFAHAADAEKKAAKGARGTPEENFKKLDTNGDGNITMEEFNASPMAQKDPAKADEMFKRKDKDGDGKISMAEFTAGGGKKGEAGATAKKGAAAEGAGKASTATDAGKSAEKPGEPAK